MNKSRLRNYGIVIAAVLAALYFGSAFGLPSYRAKNSPEAATKHDDTHTAHMLRCLGAANVDIKSIDDCLDPVALPRVVFRVDAAKNVIMRSSPDDPTHNALHGVRTDCTILDSSNWSCKGTETNPNAGLKYGLAEGDFYRTATPGMYVVEAKVWDQIRAARGLAPWPD